jgi:hypothetical protein
MVVVVRVAAEPSFSGGAAAGTVFIFVSRLFRQRIQSGSCFSLCFCSGDPCTIHSPNHLLMRMIRRAQWAAAPTSVCHRHMYEISHCLPYDIGFQLPMALMTKVCVSCYVGLLIRNAMPLLLTAADQLFRPPLVMVNGGDKSFLLGSAVRRYCLM